MRQSPKQSSRLRYWSSFDGLTLMLRIARCPPFFAYPPAIKQQVSPLPDTFHCWEVLQLDRQPCHIIGKAGLGLLVDRIQKYYKRKRRKKKTTRKDLKSSFSTWIRILFEFLCFMQLCSLDLELVSLTLQCRAPLAKGSNLSGSRPEWEFWPREGNAHAVHSVQSIHAKDVQYFQQREEEKLFNAFQCVSALSLFNRLRALLYDSVPHLTKSEFLLCQDPQLQMPGDCRTSEWNE